MNAPQTVTTGFLFCLLGFVLPVLMMHGAVATSFFLCFVSFGASVCGLFLSFLGAQLIVEGSKKELPRRRYV